MAKFADILNADLAIPQAVETKFPMLPKVSKGLAKINAKVPAGPNLPGMAVTVLEPPSPGKTGQPLAKFFNSPPFKGPVSSALPVDVNPPEPAQIIIPPRTIQKTPGGNNAVLMGKTTITFK